MGAGTPGAPNRRIGVIAATGRLGQVLVRRLLETRHDVVSIGRNPAKLAAIAGVTDRRIADLNDRAGLARALDGVALAVSCAHARFTARICEAAPEAVARLIFVGSTRCFSRLPDAAADEVLAGEAAARRSGRRWVMIHPSMIYGAAGQNNVVRIATYVRRLGGVVGLPGGGRSLIQPIHVDDVASALAAAVDRPEVDGRAIVVAGPRAITYADFVRAIGRATGHRVRVLPMPAALLVGAAGLTRLIPGLPTVSPDEIRRLLEDKEFDIAPMRTLLGLEPMDLDTGLRLTLRPRHDRRGRQLEATRQSGFLD